MNISQLYQSVAQLGFEDSLESDVRFFLSANRALLQLAVLRPSTRTLLVHHAPPRNLLSVQSFTPLEKTHELCFEASGVKSYYFECDGTGDAYIEEYEPRSRTWQTIGIVPLTGGNGFVPYRGFIKREGSFTEGKVRLRFTGEYLYFVKNVALYGNLYSAKESDIPAFEPYVRYDVSAMVKDFLALDSPPILKGERNAHLYDDYEIENDRVILLPRDCPGLYKVIYQHRPAELLNVAGGANDTTEIDLDEDLCALLPLLVAAFIWADDEPQKAEYYLSIYRERAALVVNSKKNNEPVPYRTNGW